MSLLARVGSPPASPIVGDAFFDQAANELRVFLASGWVTVTPQTTPELGPLAELTACEYCCSDLSPSSTSCPSCGAPVRLYRSTP